jgi:hypothetical protein
MRRIAVVPRSCNSHSYRCRRAHPNSTARKTSGSSCVTIGCQTGFSNPSTISSTIAATLGTHSSTNPGRLCPSRDATGQQSVTQSEDWSLSNRPSCPTRRQYRMLHPGSGRVKKGHLWAYARDERALAGRASSQESAASCRSMATAPMRNSLYTVTSRLLSVGATCAANSTRSRPAPIATEALSASPRLDTIEADNRGLSADERCQARPRRTQPLIDDLRLWLEARSPPSPAKRPSRGCPLHALARGSPYKVIKAGRAASTSWKICTTDPDARRRALAIGGWSPILYQSAEWLTLGVPESAA